MLANLLSGKEIANKIKLQLKREIALIKKGCGRIPRLSVIQVGNNKAASIYFHSQEAVAKEIGINYKLVRLKSSISQYKLIEQVKRLNKNGAITAIMLGLPIPKRIDLREVLSYIDPMKNVERINTTAEAVMELVKSAGISLYGREAVVVGHGELVGRPIAMSLLDRMATVTVCHIGTALKGNLKAHINRAEILIVAVGKPNIIKGGWVRKGSIVIDVGINKIGKRIVGDVEFKSARKKASFMTPVPGGVGPLTVIMLMRNCIELFKKQTEMRR